MDDDEVSGVYEMSWMTTQFRDPEFREIYRKELVREIKGGIAPSTMLVEFDRDYPDG